MKERLHIPAGLDGMVWHYRENGLPRSPHRHDELEFNFVLGGRASYLFGRRRVDLRRHSLIWLFPGQEHVLLNCSPDYGMWVAVFTTEVVRRLTVGRPELAVLRARRPPGQFCRTVGEPGAGGLRALLAAVAAAREKVPRYNAGLAYALLTAWDVYGQDALAAVGEDVHPAVERAARLLQDDADALELSLAALAARSGLSASRLSRLFHAQTGVTLTDFRNRQRIQRFLRLYGGGRRRTLIEAALDAGFGSYPQFHRVYKRLTGQSPNTRKHLGG